MTKRTLENWRKAALLAESRFTEDTPTEYIVAIDRILALTQELIDMELLKGEKKNV